MEDVVKVPKLYINGVILLVLMNNIFFTFGKCHGDILSNGMKEGILEEILEENVIDLGFSQATLSAPLMDVGQDVRRHGFSTRVKDINP
jgi:hypothetical protein